MWEVATKLTLELADTPDRDGRINPNKKKCDSPGNRKRKLEGLSANPNDVRMSKKPGSRRCTRHNCR